MLRYADEYFIWSKHLQLDTNQLENEYKARLNIIIYDEVMKGTILKPKSWFIKVHK